MRRQKPSDIRYLLRRGEIARHAICYYGLDPYLALWWTVTGTPDLSRLVAWQERQVA